MHFRAADSGDLDALVELVKAFYEEEHIAFDRAGTTDALGELFSNPELGEVSFIEVAGVTIGYAIVTFGFILEFGGRQLILDEFYVRPAFRGQGFGREALQRIESVARARGFKVLRLEVTRANQQAIALYEKAGFERHDRFTMTKVLG